MEVMFVHCLVFACFITHLPIITPNPNPSIKTPQVNLLIATLKPQSNGPSYSNTVIDTLAVDGWAVAFGAAMRGLDGASARPAPPRCTINGQCTNCILFDLAL